MSTWDEIGAKLHTLATTSGGLHALYKPVVRIEIYEHDDEVTVEVGRCKGMDEIVIRKGALDGRAYPEALLAMLDEALREAQKPKGEST